MSGSATGRRPGGRSNSSREYVFRPRTGLVICAVWALATLLWLVVEAKHGIGPMLLRLPLPATLGLLVFATFARPCVVITDEGLRMRNLVRDVWIPFGQMTDISTKFCLSVTDRKGKRYNAWAAPAAGRGILGSLAVPASRPDPFATTPGPLVDTTRSDAESIARALGNLRSAAGARPLPPGLDQVSAQPATPVLIALACGILLTVILTVLT